LWRLGLEPPDRLTAGVAKSVDAADARPEHISGTKQVATIVRNGNIGSRQNAGIAVSAQVPVAKWWTAILYTNVNYNKFSGMLYGENFNVEATTLLLNLSNQFTFSNGWSGELSGFYRFDDEGSPASRVEVVKDGILNWIQNTSLFDSLPLFKKGWKTGMPSVIHERAKNARGKQARRKIGTDERVLDPGKKYRHLFFYKDA